MKTAILKFVLIGFVLLVGTSEVFACLCSPPDSVCSQLKEVKKLKNEGAVFVGTVKSIKQIEIEGVDDDGEVQKLPVNKVQFNIEEKFGGKIGKTEFIHTAIEGGGCGYDFKVGKEYLVFAAYIEEVGKYATGSCSGNKEIETAENDVKLLREFSKTGKITPMIYGTVKYFPEERKPNESPKKLFRIFAQKQGSDVEIERTIESGKAFDFSNLQFGEYRFRVLVDDIVFKISQPVVLKENEACREIEISATEKDLRAAKTIKLK